jgi:thymidine phosphorylase
MSIPIILAKVRDQIPLDQAEIHEFSKGLAEGTVSDAQAAAFAMAVCLHGLSETERIEPDPGDARYGSCPAMGSSESGDR